MLISDNSSYNVDLPVYLRFLSSKRHDSVSGVVALAEFRELLPEFSITSYIADSANDNYPSYDLCSVWNIKPFIDLNSKNEGNFKYPSHLSIDDNGVPISIGGHKMIFNWFDKTRSRTKWLVPMRIRTKKRYSFFTAFALFCMFSYYFLFLFICF